MMPRLKIGNRVPDYMPVYVKDTDRFKPTFIGGATGTGKSQWLLGRFQDDSSIRVAKILIDPSGFLAKDCYSVVKGDAHYCSLQTPIALNLMLSPYKHHQVADLLAETINQMVTLTTPNQRLTVKMLQILNDEVVRCLGLGRTTLEEVRANLAAQKGNAETRDGVLARLDLLLQDEEFKQIVCGESSLEINKLIENEETFILDCSGMGFAKKVFVGTLLTNLVKAYFVYSRPNVYKPLILVIDECHNFVAQDFSLVLKEGRKYKIATILATTDFSMIPSALIHTILSNAGTLICLRAGYVEVSMISREFQTITAADIQGLEKYHAAYKTSDDEGIVKLPRPPFVRPLEVRPTGIQKPTFDLKWFDLPSYCFQLDYEPDGVVAGEDYGEQSETLPRSTEGG